MPYEKLKVKMWCPWFVILPWFQNPICFHLFIMSSDAANQEELNSCLTSTYKFNFTEMLTIYSSENLH